MTTEQTYRIVAWIDGVLYAVKPIVHVRRIAAVTIVAASINVHAQGMQASRGPHGGIAAANALQSSRSHAAAAQSGNGGPTRSVVDDFQPWPESEMRQYQKPHWVPYVRGE